MFLEIIDENIDAYRITDRRTCEIHLCATLDYVLADILTFDPIPTGVMLGGRKIIDGGFKIDTETDHGWLAAQQDSHDYSRLHDFLSDAGDEDSSPLQLWEDIREYVSICEQQPWHFTIQDFELFMAIKQDKLPQGITTIIPREGKGVNNKTTTKAFSDLLHSDNVFDCFEENKDFLVKYTTYLFEGYADLALIALYLLLKNGRTLKRCAYCGNLFSPSRTNELYCERTAPNEIYRTCKAAAKYEKQLARERASESTRVYKSVNTMKAAKIDFAKSADEEIRLRDELSGFRAEAKEWRKRVKSGGATECEYLAWLNSFKKRLK